MKQSKNRKRFFLVASMADLNEKKTQVKMHRLKENIKDISEISFGELQTKLYFFGMLNRICFIH